jgi:hypothetical protein
MLRDINVGCLSVLDHVGEADVSKLQLKVAI